MKPKYKGFLITEKEFDNLPVLDSPPKLSTPIRAWKRPSHEWGKKTGWLIGKYEAKNMAEGIKLVWYYPLIVR